MFCSYTLSVHVWILAILIAELVICQARLEGGWNSAPNTQYHIQTDEGDERYFRYQTLTGQYRKEKRLQDGSVVGTYGWVDADGWLRLKDYIADEQGYRIVRSKKLYVGASTPVDSAPQPSKYVPSQVPGVPYKPPYDTYVPVVDNSLSSTPAPYNHHYNVPAVPSPAVPYNSHDFNLQPVSTTASPYSVSSTAAPYGGSSTPPYAVSSTESPYTVGSTATPYAVSSTPSYSSPPPYESTPSQYAASSSASPYSNDYYASPVTDNSIASSTVSPYKSDIYDDYLNSKSYVSQTEKPLEFPSSNLGPISLADYLKSAASETHVQREVAITPHYRFATSTTPTLPPPVYEKSTEAPRPVTFRPYYNPNVVSSGFQHGDRNPQKDVEYDGVSLTHDGFKYYLPKQYHEEEGSSSSHRAGSFGYVDPFGIRRVIYYNTSPEKGFVHRKNNRYVGFDAPPYDPRF